MLSSNTTTDSVANSNSCSALCLYTGNVNGKMDRSAFFADGIMGPVGMALISHRMQVVLSLLDREIGRRVNLYQAPHGRRPVRNVPASIWLQVGRCETSCDRYRRSLTPLSAVSCHLAAVQVKTPERENNNHLSLSYLLGQALQRIEGHRQSLTCQDENPR